MANRDLKLTEAEYLEQYEEFLVGIADRGFDIMPTKGNFARHLGVSQADVIYWYKQHPNCKDVIDQMTADLIIEGMCLKKYQQNAGALALKNLCKWQDNPEKAVKTTNITQSNLVDEETAKKRVEGYSMHSFEARRNAIRLAK